MSNYSSLSRVLSPFRVQTLSPSQEQTKIEEISLPASQPYLYRVKMRIFFVVLAKPLGESSAVHITEEKNIIDGKTLHENDLTTFELKKLIWKELVGNEEGSNKANQWTLWKVEDLIEGGEKWKALEDIEDSNTETFIKHKLNGKKLTSAMGLKDVFSVDPPRDVIHIIVKMPTPTPATTGKRSHEDSDSDEESGTRKKDKRTPKTLASLLTSSILQPPVVMVPSHKFYDRDQALNSMLKVARSNFKGRKSPDHKDHTFILIPGGIGIGKTRMGWESQCLSSITTSSYDTPEFIEALKDPCYIPIDLNNGNKYIKGFDDGANESVRIGARVAVASGLVSEDLPDLLNTNLFRFADVICEILKRRSKKVEAIIIHLDEYQLYINDFQKHKQQSWIDSRDFFKEMLREIGSVMRGYKMASEYNGKFFIIPIITGTSAIDVHFLPTEHTRIMLNLKPLNYESAKSMFLDLYEYSRQTTDEGINAVTQSLKSHYSSDLNNKDIGKLSTEFCNFVLKQQHFRIAMFDTGFIPKFIDDLLGPHILESDFAWGNQLFTKISGRNVATVGKNPGDWEDLDDIRTVISFGLTGQLIKRDFRLKSGTSIGELERSGLIYLSNANDDWYTIIMPFMLLKVLNNKLLVSNVEPVFQDNLLLIPTHDTPWQWQNFELLYGHFQKALVDSLIYIQGSRINSVNYKISKLRLQLGEQKDYDEKMKITLEINSHNEELGRQKRHNWQLSDIFRGALGDGTLLQRKVRLHSLKVFTENEKFLVETDDVASFDKSVLCDDNVTRSLEEGVFRCYQGNANIDHRWILDSADNGKKLAIFSQIKYSERGVTTKMSTPNIKDWYDITMKSVENYKNDYDVVLVLFTNRKCTGKINIETMPHLLLIYPKNLEKYLSPTFAHRGLVDRPSEK